ncbi:alpha/beta hydrolase [Beijerinckia indica]|uniref:BD-FAE-like domain-containing protein n=1 Tax=Beijerinckia indica subsp. indica (strain ATCC 9039 / DSM 1715 / NCIMB 8712) TaxID=395963 RepID=B2IBW6_BEII9|nr:alpha/beta hydrolase [Beijerinckia indica]ACB93838.1 conserved hypothetical protein [Beijerinckia indica subsp. indica ATCC 9039]
MNRRHILTAGLSVTGLCAFSAYAAPYYGFQQDHSQWTQRVSRRDQLAVEEHIPLWEGSPPGGGGPAGPEALNYKGTLTNVSVPTISLYRPAVPNGAAILIAAGGGYHHIQMGKEAVPAAEWLNSLGITAFILAYRLPEEGWGAGRIAPFQDAQRALRLIRGRSSSFGIDPSRLGVLGFSAGAHLLGMRATRPDWSCYPPMDAFDNISDESALNLLIYPIVTLEPPYQDTQTCRILLGPDPKRHEASEWSVQTYVRRDDAPFFLVQASDDPISNPAHTAILEAACQRKGVAVARHLFPTGGHGFGLGSPGTQTVEWPSMAEHWMRQMKFI